MQQGRGRAAASLVPDVAAPWAARTGVLTTAVAAAALALSGGAALPGVAQEYPPDSATVSMSSLTVARGTTTVIAGEGWLAGSTVTISVPSAPAVLGRTEVAADGSFSTRVTIPADLVPGEHTLRVAGTEADGDPTRVEATFTVTAPDEAPEGGDERSDGDDDQSLATTGAGLLGALLSAAVLLAVGGALLRLARQRRKQGDASDR